MAEVERAVFTSLIRSRVAAIREFVARIWQLTGTEIRPRGDGQVESSQELLYLSSCPADDLAKEMAHGLEANFNNIAPFSKKDTAKELQTTPQVSGHFG